MNFILAITGFGMTATFIFLVFIRLIYKKSNPTDSRDVTDDDSESECEHSVCGLEPVTVASLPMIEFNNAALSKTENAQCSICLGEYKDKEKLRILATCNHNFHVTCIDLWLQKRSTCPVCRLSVHNSSEEHMTHGTANLSMQLDASSEFVGEHSCPWQPGHESSSCSKHNQENSGSVHSNLEVKIIVEKEAGEILEVKNMN